MAEPATGNGLTASPSVYEVGGQRFEAASRGFADAIDEAHAARPTVRHVRIRDGFGEPVRCRLKPLATDLVDGW